MDIQAASPGTLVNRLYINLPYCQTLIMEHLFMFFLLCSRFAAEHSPALPINLRKSNRIFWHVFTCGGIYVSLHVNMEYDNKKMPSFDPPLVKMKADDCQRAAGGPAPPGLYCMDPKTGGSCYIFSSLKPECSYTLMF